MFGLFVNVCFLFFVCVFACGAEVAFVLLLFFCVCFVCVRAWFVLVCFVVDCCVFVFYLRVLLMLHL